MSATRPFAAAAHAGAVAQELLHLALVAVGSLPRPQRLDAQLRGELLHRLAGGVAQPVPRRLELAVARAAAVAQLRAAPGGQPPARQPERTRRQAGPPRRQDRRQRLAE